MWHKALRSAGNKFCLFIEGDVIAVGCVGNSAMLKSPSASSEKFKVMSQALVGVLQVWFPDFELQLKLRRT